MVKEKSQTKKVIISLLVPLEFERALVLYSAKQERGTCKSHIVCQIIYDFLIKEGFDIQPIKNKD